VTARRTQSTHPQPDSGNDRTPMNRNLTTLPKAHLHLHLEGSARPDTIVELAARCGIGVEGLTAFASLPEFMECYGIAVSVITKGEDLERICYELILDEAAQGVRWCEPSIAPEMYAPALGTLDEVWLHMRAGFERGQAETGVRWGAIVSHNRVMPPEQAEQMATWAAEHAGAGIVGFGLAGDEAAVGPEPFMTACAIAAEAGLLVVPHAGETAGPESVLGALALGADRLSHGIRAAEDAALLARLADEQVTCDVCPTSNVRLAIVSHIEEHPLPQLLEAGVPVSLGSDDQLFFGSMVADEYAVARNVWRLSDSDLAEIARTSVQASGAPAAVKAGIQCAIDDWIVT
jgi:adenosine deaminase